MDWNDNGSGDFFDLVVDVIYWLGPWWIAILLIVGFLIYHAMK